jgi:SEC-C motif domain protein
MNCSARSGSCRCAEAAAACPPVPTLASTSTAAPAKPCPCGSGLAYAACCARWHAGPRHLLAPEAVLLMRSRYSAYALGLADYLRDTWHPSTRPATIEFESGLRWLGLDLRHSQSLDADHATVEFVARSKRAGRAQRLHETSRFVREGGRWYYVDGDATHR